ncbi:5623_t:CDS:2, partial [Entrophospora sp. SA101]
MEIYTNKWKEIENPLENKAEEIWKESYNITNLLNKYNKAILENSNELSKINYEALLSVVSEKPFTNYSHIPLEADISSYSDAIAHAIK